MADVIYFDGDNRNLLVFDETTGFSSGSQYDEYTFFTGNSVDEYIKIVSGMGEANPNALLVVPLIMEEKVYGVIEIASFKKFEKYHIEFVEKVAHDIAATLRR